MARALASKGQEKSMKLAMQGVIGVVGLFNMLVGFGFLFRPDRLAQQFAVVPLGAQGLATMRADFPAFFLTGALFALIGAWRADPKPLVVPLVLVGIAIFGRFVGVVVDGHIPATFAPMIAEAGMIAALLLARKTWKA